MMGGQVSFDKGGPLLAIGGMVGRGKGGMIPMVIVLPFNQVVRQIIASRVVAGIFEIHSNKLTSSVES